ncbi:MAG: bifunctional phosphopantothenoylcysteine decarboxylase/phosphopantothenate--cysteine ligase CoaBC [bacterium]
MLKGKKILLGITGSIAAYKAALLVRLLVKNEAEVRVLMTPLSKEFITPLTLATLSQHPILIDFFDPESGSWNSHVDLGSWADAFLVAPATANTMAKMAHGIADNLLLTTYLSARCPVFVAPAMDLDMFQHPSTKKNIDILASYGNSVIEPTIGELASGLEGKGRMEEPGIIVDYLSNFFLRNSLNDTIIEKLKGKRILITAGPTREPIDKVRFIGNHSSGKMAFAIAEVLHAAGAEVTIICGPVSEPLPKNMKLVEKVETAEEMYDAALRHFNDSDIAILAAAVADYTPAETLDKKLKRGDKSLPLILKPTKDIAASLGSIKKDNQLLIGFALETDNPEINASEKLKKKNLDFIVLNSLTDKGAGFYTDTNKITIIGKNNKSRKFELKSKREVAHDIITELASYF